MARIAGVVGYDMENIGDNNASPLLYFKFPYGTKLYTLYDFGSAVDEEFVIVGGGGLLGGLDGTINRVQALMRGRREHQCFIAWGLGLHRHGSAAIDLPEAKPWYIDEFELFGTRDDLPLRRWVPCASCMHPRFDTAPEPVHDVVIYSHKSIALDVHLMGAPRRRSDTNDFPSLESALDFLASGAVIITNSYHGAYWGTLLGRKVIVVDPWSTKFTHMRHPPALVAAADWEAAIDRAQIYEGALEECREANISFHSDVLNLMA